MKYYCIHHSPAVDRKSYMVDLFALNKIHDISWIEDYLPDSEDVKEWDYKVKSQHAAKDGYLNRAEISCFLKHRKAIKYIAESGERGVIIEDDIVVPQFDMKDFIDDFLSKKCTADNILFIGSFGDKDISDSDDYAVHFSYSYRSRCAHAYMISADVAIKILPLLKNIEMPFDWQLNSVIEHLNLNVGWTKPHIYQRTEKGYIQSMLR